MSRRILDKSHDHSTLAVIARIIAGLSTALMGAFAKVAGDGGAGSGELIFFRHAGALPVILAWILMGPGLHAVRTKRPGAHVIRGILGLAAMSFMFHALVLLPLSETLTILFISPLVATCLSAILLHEKVGIHRWIAISVGFSGVLIIMQPGASGSEISILGLAMAVIAAVLMALIAVTIRQLGTTETEAATVFWFTVAGTVATGCLYPFFYKPHEPFIWLMMMGVGVCGAAVQVNITMSLRLAPISLTAPFDYIQLFWAALIGWWIWSDLPAWTTVAGGLLIAGSGLFTFYRERLKRQSIAEQATPTS